MLSRLNAAGAVGALQTAAAADPRRADARNMLGLALSLVGREVEAMKQFEEALRLRPDYAAARFNLANAQMKAGKFGAAIENLRQVIAASPDDPLPKKRLEEALTAEEARKARH
jgi:tetratricopeptide (TPR) repeat protein